MVALILCLGYISSLALVISLEEGWGGGKREKKVVFVLPSVGTNKQYGGNDPENKLPMGFCPILGMVVLFYY